MLAVVVAQKLLHSGNDHQSYFAETGAMAVSHTKLEAMRCVTELIRMQVDDGLAAVELEHGTSVRAVASQLRWIVVG